MNSKSSNQSTDASCSETLGELASALPAERRREPYRLRASLDRSKFFEVDVGPQARRYRLARGRGQIDKTASFECCLGAGIVPRRRVQQQWVLPDNGKTAGELVLWSTS
jgi:hypothetical protein